MSTLIQAVHLPGAFRIASTCGGSAQCYAVAVGDMVCVSCMGTRVLLYPYQRVRVET